MEQRTEGREEQGLCQDRLLAYTLTDSSHVYLYEKKLNKWLHDP